MINRTETRAISRLFAGYDSDRHTVPAELLDARARVARLDDTLSALRPSVAERSARDAAVRAVLDDPTADVAGPVLAGQRADDAAKVRAEVLRDARATAVSELSLLAVDLAETVFVDHLRPGLADVLERAKAAHSVYAPHGSNEAELFQAPAKVRAAWTEFAAAADGYQALVAARDALLDLSGRAEQDDRGLFALIRNTEQVWPELLTSQMPVSTMVRPWPAGGGRDFLVWALEHGAELWLPTGAEQDARWLEVYGPRIAEQQRSNHVAGQYRALVV